MTILRVKKRVFVAICVTVHKDTGNPYAMLDWIITHEDNERVTEIFMNRFLGQYPVEWGYEKHKVDILNAEFVAKLFRNYHRLDIFYRGRKYKEKNKQ